MTDIINKDLCSQTIQYLHSINNGENVQARLPCMSWQTAMKNCVCTCKQKRRVGKIAMSVVTDKWYERLSFYISIMRKTKGRQDYNVGPDRHMMIHIINNVHTSCFAIKCRCLLSFVWGRLTVCRNTNDTHEFVHILGRHRSIFI